jgi:putative intracellular protease/amidase
MDAAAARPTVRIGVFMPSGAQVLDTACVDIFEMMGHGYLSLLPFLPAAVAELAPIVSIAYVGTVQPGEPIEMTAGMRVLCTHHFSDPEVQPGKLDIVLVPGPDPTLRWADDVLGWLRAHAERVDETDILSVCTGIYVCGEAGLLKGKRACGPRGLQKEIKERFEGVTLVGDELRWVQDGNFWSSGTSSLLLLPTRATRGPLHSRQTADGSGGNAGGVTNGNDLVVAYARQSSRFPGPLVDVAIRIADVGDRPQKFDVGQTAFTLGFVWVLLRAWVLGFGGRKQKRV